MSIVRKFTFTDLILKKLDGKLWEVHKKIVLRVYTRDQGVYTFNIEPGFIFDLGSIPSRLQGIVNPGTCDDEVMAAYLLHDLLYGTHYLSKRTTDKLLFEMLDGYLADRWDRYLVYGAVKYFGGLAWNKRENTIILNRQLSKFFWLDSD